MCKLLSGILEFLKLLAKYCIGAYCSVAMSHECPIKPFKTSLVNGVWQIAIIEYNLHTQKKI
jgi:hypothetical protein